MKSKSLCFALSLLLLVLCSCTNDKFRAGGYDDTKMNVAMNLAKGQVDDFITALEKKDGTRHAVKVKMLQGDQIEYMWLTKLSFKNGRFEGTIANKPQFISSVQPGQTHSVAKEEIADWMYFKGQTLHGNFTLRVFVDDLPKDDQAAFLARVMAQ